MRCVVIYNNPEYNSETPFPSIGSIGEIVSDRDEEGDLDVMFDDYPCPVGGPEWVTHESMIVILPDFKIVANKDNNTLEE